MKVLFVQDVRGVAKKGEVQDVAAGYAENFLLPKHLALAATPAIIRRAEEEIARKAKVEAAARADARALAEHLQGYVLRLTRRAEKRKLFGAITAQELANLLGTEEFRVDRKMLKLLRPIKMLGEYRVEADLGQGSKAVFLVVVSEE